MIRKWKNYWEARLDNKNIRADGRNAAQRDYARVIHSSAFRRLQSKTQVLGLGDSDFYRTRLTHSLEVCQIGEEIMRNLLKKYNSKKAIKDIIPKSEQIRAICLAHDLGHPPFGHGGEQALNKIMNEHGGFEANGQSLRIMTKIPSYHDKYGMNLSRRTLLGVIKYPAPYQEVANICAYPNGSISEFPASKFKPPKCYYNEEQGIIDWITEEVKADWEIVKRVTYMGSRKHGKTNHMSLDARIMDIADDIAYGVHDLEDAISLRFIKRSVLESSEISEKLKSCLGYRQPMYQHLLDFLFSEMSHKRKEAIGSLVSICVKSVEVEVNNGTGLKNPIFAVQAKLNENKSELLKVLKDVVYKNVIKTPRVQQLEHKGKIIIQKLFNAFETDPENLLPTERLINYNRATCSSSRKRIICDYVAGMTDDYAIRRYQQMFIPDMGSVFDHLG